METKKPLPKVELWSLSSLIKNAQQMHEDAAYKVSKNVKDPKQNRHNKGMYDWTGSLVHHFTELEALKLKEGN